jgi:ATP-binding cassette subfamily C protein LapB
MIAPSSASSQPSPSYENHFAACLASLLELLRWRGTGRQIAEATGLQAPRNLAEFRNVLANLGYGSSLRRCRFDRIDPRLLPCLFIANGRPILLASAGSEPGTLIGYDGSTGAVTEFRCTSQRGSVCHFQTLRPSTGLNASGGSWMRRLMERFEVGLGVLLGLTLILNVLALVPAFFVQAVYDAVLPTRSPETLAFLVAGAAFALLCDLALRVIRAAAMAQFGARLDFLIGTAVFDKLLSLPTAQLESVSIGRRMAQLRDYEALRGAFAGPLAISVLEMPFALVFVAAIAAIGGWLALIPIVIGAVTVVSGLMLIRYARHAMERSRQESGDMQTLLVEMLAQMPTIKASGAEAIWLARLRERSAEAAISGLRQARVAGLCESFAYAINLVAGAATLAIGALVAMDGSLSVGALIASMTLVWRLLGPVQAMFLALARIDQIQASVRRIDQTLALPSEARFSPRGGQRSATSRFAGRITLDRVLLRYENHHEAALMGVSVDVRPGEIVAVTGGNGSGKSSILKLVAALYQPQAGLVLIDGADIRQLGPDDVRQRIALLPQACDLFPGTIRENLLLASPLKSESDLWDALLKVGLCDAIDALPQKLDTDVGPNVSVQFARKLALARTLLVDANIVLLDEPGPLLDDEGEDLLIEQLHALRGRVTVLIATHHPDHVSVADRVLVLRNGIVVHDGTPKQLMTRSTEKAA